MAVTYVQASKIDDMFHGRIKRPYSTNVDAVDDLRLYLILIGALVVFLVYGFGRRNKSPAVDVRHESWMPEIDRRIDPNYKHRLEDGAMGESETRPDNDANEDTDLPDYDGILYQINQLEEKQKQYTLFKRSDEQSQRIGKSGFIKTPKMDTAALATASDIEPLIIVLNVLARDGGQFDGEKVKSAFHALGLNYGEMSIYHYYPEGKPGLGHKQSSLFSVASAVKPGRFDINDMDSFKTPGLSLILQLPGPMEGVLAFELLQYVANGLARKLGGIVCDGIHNRITQQSAEHLKDQIAAFNLKLHAHHQQMLN